VHCPAAGIRNSGSENAGSASTYRSDKNFHTFAGSIRTGNGGTAAIIPSPGRQR
jgi:hypothetical protein